MQGVSVTECYGFGVGAIHPTFPCTLLVFPPHRRSSILTFEAPHGTTYLITGGPDLSRSEQNPGQTELYGSGVEATPSTFTQT